MSDANRISLNPDGYIEATIEGDQTKMSFEHLHLNTEEMMGLLQKQGRQQLGLIDVTKQGKFSPDSNKEAMLILEKLPYDKLAIFGANIVLAQVINAIILAMGKSANTKLFADRQSALAWLQETSDS
ncbi:MAG TPA: hypothetical protein VLH38_02365 [Patescibacteria group bacterium]|nr:hypothetical protein [Patescibacteria group bacterium]